MRTLTRDELKRRPSRLLSSGRNRTKADVSLIELDSERVVLKDFRGRGFLVRNTIGRFSVARECRALGRLAGLPGIPALRERIDAHALAWEWVEGRSLPELRPRSLAPGFFDELERLVAAVHDRGVAVADLHHRNVLVSAPTGRPALIDFSLAVARPEAQWNLPGRWLFARAAELDRVAAARIRARYQTPERAGADAGVSTAGDGTSVTATRIGSDVPTTKSRTATSANGVDARVPPAGARMPLPMTGPGKSFPAAGTRPAAPSVSPSEGLPRWYRWGRSLKRFSRRLRGRT